MKSIIKFIKELGAYYNPLNGKIEGCEEGGITWHHESRHLQQFQWKVVKNIFGWLSFCALISLTMSFCGLIDYFNKAIMWEASFLLAGILAFPYLIFTTYIEIDAWVYSIRLVLKK